MITYVIIGMVWTMIIDYCTYRLKLGEAEFTNTERIISIFFWPIILLIVIITFIKLNKNKNE